MDYKKLLELLPIAKAAYGNGSSSGATSVGTWAVTPVTEFRPETTNFQVEFYKIYVKKTFIFLNLQVFILFSGFCYAQFVDKNIKIDEMVYKINKYNSQSGSYINFYVKGNEYSDIVLIVKENKEKNSIFIRGKVDCEFGNYLLDKNYLYISNLVDHNYGLAGAYVIEKYVLEINDDGEPGIPKYAFVFLNQKRTKNSYCDGINPIRQEALK